MIVTREVECSSQPRDAKLSLAPRSGDSMLCNSKRHPAFVVIIA